MVTKTAEVLTIGLGKPQSNGNGFSLRLTTGRSEKQSTLRIRHPPGLCSPKLLIEKRKIGYQFEAWWFFNSGRLFPCIRLLSIMANSGSWKRMKRVFFPWGKKNRNQPPPPPPPSFDELTSSPGIQCFSFNFNKTRCSILLLGFSVCF